MSELFSNSKCKVVILKNGRRSLISLRNIKAGETILQEQPILLWSLNGQKRCSNCYQLTDQQCSLCHISPLCKDCGKHNQYDCNKLSSMKDVNLEKLLKFNNTFGIIKCLLLRENPLTEIYFQQLLDTILEQKTAAKFQQDQPNKNSNRLQNQKCAVQCVLESGICKYLRQCHEITYQLLLDLCSLLEVDSFEIRAPDGQAMNGFYLQGSLLAHNCYSNTVINIDELYAMKIYASCNILQDTEINHCYINVLLGTKERRRLLWESKGLLCNCERCKDPAELGSHMSTLLCPQCHQKNLTDRYLLPNSENSNDLSYYKCSTCNFQKSLDDVNQEIEQLQININEIQKNGGNLYQYEELLSKFVAILHPHHYLMIDIKQNMAVILREILNDVSHCPGRYVYKRKIKLCEDILAVLQIIQPGISRLKAIALYELANTEAEYYRLLYQENDLSKNQLIEYLKKIEVYLRESIRMLLYEPKTTPEGQLTRSMLQELKYLQMDIKMLK